MQQPSDKIFALYSGDFVDWGKAVDDKDTWRTLTTKEWQYLINKNNDENIRKGKYKYGVTVCEKANCLWSSTANNESESKAHYVNSDGYSVTLHFAESRQYGFSVRLVTEVPAEE